MPELEGNPRWQRLESGIKIRDLRVGAGPPAQKWKTVLLSYDCRLSRGAICSSSRLGNGWPLQFHIGERTVVPGLERGVVGMRVGGRRSIQVSPHLAYGEEGIPPTVPPNAVLTYDVALLHVADCWYNRPDRLFPQRGILRRFTAWWRRLLRSSSAGYPVPVHHKASLK